MKVLIFFFPVSKPETTVGKKRGNEALGPSLFTVLNVFVSQDKGVSISVVGVGSLVYKKEAKMRKIAGTDGKVFLYADFALLSSRFDEIMESACSKLLLLVIAVQYYQHRGTKRLDSANAMK